MVVGSFVRVVVVVVSLQGERNPKIMCLDPCEAAEAGVAHFPGEVMEGPLLRSVLIINGVAVWKQSHRLKSCKTRGLGTQRHIMGLPQLPSALTRCSGGIRLLAESLQ